MRTRRLIVVTPEGERELLFIGRLTVGRAPECDISVADTKISRRHAEFDASGQTPRVSDLGSRNGILVNGRKVGAADLAPGDVVTVGDARIRFEERAVDLPDPGVSMSANDDRTEILAPLRPVQPRVAEPIAPAAPLFSSEPASADHPDKTSVLTARPAVAPVPPVATPFVPDSSGERTSVLPPPLRRAPMPPPALIPPPEPAAPVAATVRIDASAAPAPAPPMPPAAPAAPPRAAVAALPPVAPLVAAPSGAAPPAPAAPAAALATGSALKGPRFSWGGLVTCAAVVLAGLAVLLGALPLMSASSSALDALSQRQASTLAGWLAAGVHPQAANVVDSAVMEAVQAQPGVERAMVLERATGRAVAPASLDGRAFSSLPGVGEGWRDLTSPRAGRVDMFADAYVPAGDGAYLAWVRYERPTDDTGLAIMVALVATLVFAMLVALLIKRHTKATLQHFTRQVELAVSGASPTVMQGTLMPGLERLPGVVTYLLERRTGQGGAPGSDVLRLTDSDEAGLPLALAPPFDPGPPWLEVTPSLTVADSSDHGPSAGAPLWSTARGRHLLDVLDNGPVRNAVVQGLGALGMTTGAEANVSLPGEAPIALRREQSGHVRVTLGAR